MRAALQPVDFSKIYKDANPDALDLMTRMLKFNPADRINVAEALAHPYLAPLHDAAAEPSCPANIFLGFEDDNLDGEQVRERMFKEIVSQYCR
jgi:serine/threonine protein kinase